MTYLQSIVLGIIQGVTEFLPISSSGHLVFAVYVFNWVIPQQDIFVFDVLVQLGTLLAVIIYFWRDLYQIGCEFILGIFHRRPFASPDSRIGWFLILATIPAVLIGSALKDQIEVTFSSPLLAGVFLLVTAGLLVVAEKASRLTRSLQMVSWRDALIMGFFQALALFPGISRSGATITGGMIRNLDRTASARFSFLMSIPVMLGAGILASLDLFKVPDLSRMMPVVLLGFLTSAIVGYLAIRWLLHYLVNHSLYLFAIYCTVIGTAVILSVVL